MISAEELLKPVSAEKPCGEDISYDPSFLELETMMRGKPDTQFEEAEEPDWKKIGERCLELWKRSKHLRVATALTVAEIETDGFAGFRECLALMNGLVGTCWAEVYPRLDPADANDPTERVNIIASLAAPLGTFGDSLRVIERLRDLPLTSSRMGNFSMADILRSQAGKPGADGQAPPAESQVKAAFGDTGKEAMDGLVTALSSAGELVGSLEDALTKAVGADKAASLDTLKKEIEAIRKQVTQYSPESLAGVALEAVEGGEDQPRVGAPAAAVSGEIQSRRDVIRMLDKICRCLYPPGAFQPGAGFAPSGPEPR